MRWHGFVVAALLLAACGSDDDDDGGAAGGQAGSSAGGSSGGGGAGQAGAGGAAGQGGAGQGGAGQAGAGQGGAGQGGAGAAGVSGTSGQGGGFPAGGTAGAAGQGGAGQGGGGQAGGGQAGSEPGGGAGAAGSGGGASGAAGTAGAGGACVASTQEAKLEKRPVDVMVYIDTSASMAPALAAVETNIDQNFAQKIGASGLDYRVIMLTDADVPKAPKEPARWYRYVNNGGSGALHENLLSWYNVSAAQNKPPGGYSDWVREGSFKVFLVISDTSSGPTMPGAEFDQKLLALTPARFGTAEARDYRYHAIVGLAANDPATKPWGPADPIVSGKCSGYSGSLGNGVNAQQVAILTGGLRFPMCQFDSYDVVFSTIAEGIVKSTGVACEFPVPTATDGQPLDPDTLLLSYHPGGGSATETLKQVKDAATCAPDRFYVEGADIKLCASTCQKVKADPQAVIDVTYGCDVGYKP